MPNVSTFNERKILEDLKKSGNYEAIDLIRAYKETLENQRRITAMAVKRLRENGGGSLIGKTQN